MPMLCSIGSQRREVEGFDSLALFRQVDQWPSAVGEIDRIGWPRAQQITCKWPGKIANEGPAGMPPIGWTAMLVPLQ